MIVNSKRFKLSIAELLMYVIAVWYAIGIRGMFKVCEPMGDSFMSCHWAGETLKAMSILMLVLGLMHILMPDERVKLGMDIAFVGIYVCMLMIPGGAINLCMMEDMRCRSLTQPWTIGLSIAGIIMVLADAFICLSALNKAKHRREDQED